MAHPILHLHVTNVVRISHLPPVYIIFVNGLNFNYKHIKYVEKIGILLEGMDDKGGDIGKFTLQKKGLC